MAEVAVCVLSRNSLSQPMKRKRFLTGYWLETGAFGSSFDCTYIVPCRREFPAQICDETHIPYTVRTLKVLNFVVPSHAMTFRCHLHRSTLQTQLYSWFDTIETLPAAAADSCLLADDSKCICFSGSQSDFFFIGVGCMNEAQTLLWNSQISLKQSTHFRFSITFFVKDLKLSRTNSSYWIVIIMLK